MRTTITLSRTLDAIPTVHGTFRFTALDGAYRFELNGTTLFETDTEGTPIATLSDAFDLLAEFCDSLPALGYDEARALAVAAPKVVRGDGWSRLQQIHDAHGERRCAP